MEEECLSNVDVFLREEMTEHGDTQTADVVHRYNLTHVRKLVLYFSCILQYSSSLSFFDLFMLLNPVNDIMQSRKNKTLFFHFGAL